MVWDRGPAIGENSADNAFDSSLVVANRDGSTLERLEWLINESGAMIIGEGTFTTDSATVPADTTMGGTHATGYWDGKLLMTLTGNVAFQPRVITSYTDTTGVFTLDAQHPFTTTPGLVAYVILAGDISLVPAADATANTLPSHVIGNKADASAVPSAATSIVAIIKKIYDTAISLVTSLLTLTETGGTVTTDGTEQNVYINNAPAGVYDPKIIQVDFTNQTAAETLVLREYYRIKSGGGLVMMDERTFPGVQDPLLKNIRLEENRYGVKVTLELTAGTNRDYDWEAVYAV